MPEPLTETLPQLPPGYHVAPKRVPVVYGSDKVSILMDESEEKRLKALRYRAYLGPFFVRPMADEIRRQAIKKLFSTHDLTYSLWVNDNKDLTLLKQIVLEYITSFEVVVTWGWKTTQAMVEEHFKKETTMTDLNDYDVLVIIHTGSEITHTYNLDLTCQVESFRKLNGKHTLFIAPSESTVSKGMGAVNPFPHDAVSAPAAKLALSGESTEKAPPSSEQRGVESPDIGSDVGPPEEAPPSPKPKYVRRPDNVSL